jgi:transcription initiation factor TFIIB
MSSYNAREQLVSDGQTSTTEQRSRTFQVEHEPSARSACPECEGQVLTKDEQSFCTDCGLIVADQWVDLSPTLNDLGMVGGADQSIETVDPLRTDKGLHTKIGKSIDGYGNPLSNEQWEKVQRLRKWHNHVVKMAAQFLRSASEARLPGGRMAWEALAGGAVLLALRASSVDRDEIDVAVATHTKAPHERVCAAARKIRCECGFDAPLIRPNAVMEVVDALDADAIPGARAVRTWRLAQHLMQLGDQVPVGPGTPRCTVAASALYAADRLLSRKHLTQAQVVAAASTIVPTSRNRIARYSRELVDAYEAEHGTDDSGVGLEEERDTLR